MQTTSPPYRDAMRLHGARATVRAVGARAGALESLAALGACTVVAVLVSWRLLHANVYSDDALVHQYWMWQFRDPQLFVDPLTAALRESARYPKGYEALFWLASHVADPIAFGEVLGVALMAISGWLVFAVVREHTAWRPAAWIAAGLFLALIDIHRFHGGFPRAFVHPVVLLTVLLALRRRPLRAALVASGGALLYPPAALLAVGVLIVSALRWTGRPARAGEPAGRFGRAWRRVRLDTRHAAFAGLALALALLAVVGPALASGGSPRVLTAAEARLFPDFGPHGPLHFFAPSTLDYLRQNRSGFDLRVSGSILALAALALLVVRRGNVRLLRVEVLALPVVSLALFALSQAVLFKLYLPHRYTYPLVAFFAIVVGVALRPTWTALWARRRPRALAFALLCAPVAVACVAIYAFPLGPLEPLADLASATTIAVAGGAVVLAAAGALVLGRLPPASRPALGALLTGLALLGVLVFVPARSARGTACPVGPATRYLATLPKDAVIAGDPLDLKCLPATARRPVVISTQLAPSYEVDYFHQGRARMFAMLRAYYGPSIDAIVALRAQYGATALWVRRDALRRELAGDGVRWHAREQPFGRFVRGLASAGEPAALHLPAACRRWHGGPGEVYDIACLAGRR